MNGQRFGRPQEEDQALKQERQARQARARNLFITLGTLALGKGSPAELAADILDYDENFFRRVQAGQEPVEITGELLDKAMATLKECALQWKQKQGKKKRAHASR
jgi:hypothetical protein